MGEGVFKFCCRGDEYGLSTVAIDNTKAYNRIFDDVRAAVSAGISPVLVILPPGNYRTEGSINATGIQAKGWVVQAAGHVIESHATGKAAFDLANSRFGRFYDLFVKGDQINMPRCGYQLGRVNTTEVADNHSFSFPQADGYFQKTCWYNRSAETITAVRPQFYNKHVGADVYCMVQDGMQETQFGYQSDYQTITVADETPLSFNENEIIGLDARKTEGIGRGPVLFLNRTGRHRFEQGFVATDNNHAIEVFGSSDLYGHLGLYLDIHCESTGLETCVAFTGTFPQTLSWFYFHDQQPLASSEVFLTTAGNRVNIENGDINVPVVPNLINGIFNDKAQFYGYNLRVYTRSGAEMTNLGRLIGELQVDDRNSAQYGVGTQVIRDSTSAALAIKGQVNFYDSAATAVGVGALGNTGEVQILSGHVNITDGITAPGQSSGFAKLYVDTADGDLKVKFGNGTVKTLATNP